MVEYLERADEDFDFPSCTTQADSPWMVFFILITIIIFFIIPLLVLVILYTIIARHLMANPAISRGPANNLLKYRKQVVLMLGTVVLCFFICLLPFRAFTLWVLVTPTTTIVKLGIEGYFGLLYVCRVMLYLNSAINPILYNLMSTKFREGFLRLCGLGTNRRKDKQASSRTRTYTTGSTNCSSNHSDFWRRHSSNNKSTSNKQQVPDNVTTEKQAICMPLFSAVTHSIIKSTQQSKQESYV